MLNLWQRRIVIAPAFHEILGREQTVGSLLAIATVTLLAGGAWWLTAAEDVVGLATWRLVLAGLLMLDIAAGAASNFTPGVNEFYAQRPVHRRVFIAVHFHLPLVGWLLALPMVSLWLVWGYTILAALGVNAHYHQPRQSLWAGALLCIGLILAPLLPDLSGWTLSLALLFMTKVLYSFAVNHYRTPGHPHDV